MQIMKRKTEKENRDTDMFNQIILNIDIEVVIFTEMHRAKIFLLFRRYFPPNHL